ncbi:MAG: RDD family protein [Planctomycetota bacterium]|nr:RDD family protein [Planctomycetota bacterium]
MGRKRKPLDTRIEIVTPENIGFQYRIAGPFRRLPAYLIDVAIRFGVAIVALIVIGIIFGMAQIWGVGVGLWLLLLFLMDWFYGGFFETIWNGQTPGKRLMRIRVLSSDGQAINALQAVLRNILRAADWLPFGYLLGLLTATMNDRFQRLGDLACGTMVVIEERQWLAGVAQVQDPLVHRLAAEIPVGFQPDRALAQTLAAYVGRRLNFPPERRAQLACYLAEPLGERLGLPADTDPDRLLCALYQRTFITEEELEEQPASAPQSPFATSNPFATTAGAKTR